MRQTHPRAEVDKASKKGVTRNRPYRNCDAMGNLIDSFDDEFCSILGKYASPAINGGAAVQRSRNCYGRFPKRRSQSSFGIDHMPGQALRLRRLLINHNSLGGMSQHSAGGLNQYF